MRAAILAILTAACGGGSKSSTTPKEPVACAAVADSMVTMMSEGKESSQAFVETKQGFTTIIRTRCEQDAWTAEAKQCLATMKTRADADRFVPMLTEAQQANLVRDQKEKYGAKPAESDNAPAEPPTPEPAAVMPATGAAAPPPPAPTRSGATKDKSARGEPANVEPPKNKPKGSGPKKPGDPCDGGE